MGRGGGGFNGRGEIATYCMKFSTTPQDQCGSGLARECGGSVNISLTDPPHSRASPLPHLELCAVS
ncbi:hypothetical protein CWC48_04890 [Pseudomonas sp. S10E 269]|nr:hypothetical protein CWC49_15050 [Pseudomonas sp. S09F 262]PJK38494.1 hypothetical protein CWC48_04890 [Pseudomonas sp. S10E 269]